MEGEEKGKIQIKKKEVLDLHHIVNKTHLYRKQVFSIINQVKVEINSIISWEGNRAKLFRDL